MKTRRILKIIQVLLITFNLTIYVHGVDFIREGRKSRLKQDPSRFVWEEDEGFFWRHLQTSFPSRPSPNEIIPSPSTNSHDNTGSTPSSTLPGMPSIPSVSQVPSPTSTQPIDPTGVSILSPSPDALDVPTNNALPSADRPAQTPGGGSQGNTTFIGGPNQSPSDSQNDENAVQAPGTSPSFMSPSLVPTLNVNIIETNFPSFSPTVTSSSVPSNHPSTRPSIIPSPVPSQLPTLKPSIIPSQVPSSKPSVHPSILPTNRPSQHPSLKPSTHPSITPTISLIPSISLVPSAIPTFCGGFTPDGRVNEITTILSDISDPINLNDPTTPQGQALQFITVDDPMIPPYCPSDTRLIQRYILSLFYFSTNGDTWLDSKGFLSGVEECDWVTCDARDRVVILRVDHNNVSGTIPTEIRFLERLFDLDLDGNQMIGGSMPDIFGDLPLLTTLDLDDNQLSGTIPESIYTKDLLGTLDLNDNQISGTISNNISNLSRLIILQLDDNLMTGTIPTVIGELSDLRECLFSQNFLCFFIHNFCIIPHHIYVILHTL